MLTARARVLFLILLSVGAGLLLAGCAGGEPPDTLFETPTAEAPVQPALPPPGQTLMSYEEQAATTARLQRLAQSRRTTAPQPPDDYLRRLGATHGPAAIADIEAGREPAEQAAD